MKIVQLSKIVKGKKIENEPDLRVTRGEETAESDSVQELTPDEIVSEDGICHN